LVEDRDTARGLARIEALRAEGLTYREIAAALELEGISTAKGGHRWDPRTVQRILQRLTVLQSTNSRAS
jgi:hypothetical protein